MFFDREIVYPRGWSEASLDFKIFFASFAAIMVIFMAGRLLSVQIELICEAILLAAVGLVLAWRRRVDGWRWAGAGTRQLLNVAAVLAVFVVFCGAVVLLTPPNSKLFLPWYLGLGNIGLFNLLIALRIVRPTQAAYDDDCRPPAEEPVAPPEPHDGEARWKRNAKIAYQLAFMLVWLDSVASFFAEGAAAPNTESLRLAPFMGAVAHALVVLQNPDVRRAMLAVMFVGIPCVIGVGFLLQYRLGVAVFPSLSTRGLPDGRGGGSRQL